MEILCAPVGPLQANCYIVRDDNRSALVIDPGGEPERLLRIIQSRGLTVHAILVTHGHFDHVEGVQGLAEGTGATVYCSSLVVPVLTGRTGCSATGFPIPPVSPELIREINDGSEVAVGDLVAKVISTPGHTPGDLTFEVGGHLFPGDLIFYRSVGRTDFPGGNFSQLLASVRKLALLYPPSTPVHPGHMQSTTLGDELAHNPFLGGLDTSD
ncbi:MAG: MBL fold metallo-hydrolase [Thermoleophilia bacterium]|nr:MBL fold metallo-hydrolase [Thermoleophilia bacterium]